jgi:hypothetical protein
MSIWTTWSYLLAPIWAMVWHWGTGIGLIAIALAVAWFSPLFKKTALWVAAAIAVYLAGLAVGSLDTNRLWVTKEKATLALGQKARTDAENYINRDPATAHWWLRNNRDRYDRDQSAVHPVARDHVLKGQRHQSNRKAGKGTQPNRAKSPVLEVERPCSICS